MACSMGDYFQVVTPYLKPDLVSSEALSHIQFIAQLLPPSIGGLECRLGPEQPRVDFAVNVPHGTLFIPEKFQHHPVWQAIKSLYQAWSESASPLHQSVNNLNLEFDLDGQLSEVLIPCLFLDLSRDILREFSPLKEIIDHCTFKRILDQSIASQLSLNLHRCFHNLPEKAWIAHLGVMLSRPKQTVMVVIKGLSAKQISEYLIQMGWQTSTEKLNYLLADLSEFVDSLNLDLYIDDQVCPQIGIECYLGNQLPDESRWYSLFNYLIAQGLCTKGKQDGLFAWPGIIQKNDYSEKWPNNLTLGDQFLNSLAFSIFYRKISHIKIVYHPNFPLSAKAYLEFGHHWINRNLISSVN
jgi:hypothetical protein